MRFRKLHPWQVSPTRAIQIQNQLQRRIILRKPKTVFRFIAACDVSFVHARAVAVVVVMSLPELKLVETIRKEAKVIFPYIPGLLTFREGPVLERCFKAMKIKPDVILFDGQGIAHPRNMGIATHMGILLNQPTIGCAKTWLWGNYKRPQTFRGAFSYLRDKNKRIGIVLRTQDGIEPVFVSAGYKIDIATCRKLILLCSSKFRIPEPLRLAHQLGRLP